MTIQSVCTQEATKKGNEKAKPTGNEKAKPTGNKPTGNEKAKSTGNKPTDKEKEVRTCNEDGIHEQGRGQYGPLSCTHALRRRPRRRRPSQLAR